MKFFIDYIALRAYKFENPVACITLVSLYGFLTTMSTKLELHSFRLKILNNNQLCFSYEHTGQLLEFGF